MRPAGSLRLRLMLGAAVWIVVALLVAGLILAELFARHVHDRFAAELGHHLDQLAVSLRTDASGRPELARPPSDPRFGRPLSGLYWQVTAGGRVVLRSRSLWDQTLPRNPADSEGASEGEVVDDGRIHQRLVEGPGQRPVFLLERSLLLPDAPEPLQATVAEDLGELEVALAAFNRTLALSLAALAAALILAAVVQVTLGLRPLRWLRDELAGIRAGRSRRFERPMPSEVQPLIDDLNALLDHADAVVERARLQAGNLAHGLKTNLAVLANEAERLSAADRRPEDVPPEDVPPEDVPPEDAPRQGAPAEVPPPEGTPPRRAELAVLVLAQVASMRRHLDHHMARARAAVSRGLPGSVTDVGECAAALVRVMRKVHAGRDLAIESGIPAGLLFAGDRQDLEEMLGNLLDNACKWAAHTVAVSAARQGGMLVVHVDDDGCGLTPEQAAALSPGTRLDESVPGSGLGLGVVRDLVQSYGGTLVLAASPGSGGLRASLHLPAAPPG